MSNYSKLTDFAAKDSLNTGNPSKIVKGTEIDDELTAISGAIASKADLAGPTFTGTTTLETVTATALTATTLTVSGNASIGAAIFEGTTADDYETTLNAVDPTADRTISLPNKSGTVALTSDIELLSSTAVESTSGTSIDFTGIPSWVKRITVMFNGVSTNGSSVLQVQLGDSGGMEDTGYLSTSSTAGGTVTAITSGFAICGPASASVVSGHCVITLIDSANTWIQTSLVKSATNTMAYSAGNKTTSGTLTQLRITTVGGANTFDAGSINILYE